MQKSWKKWEFLLVYWIWQKILEFSRNFQSYQGVLLSVNFFFSTVYSLSLMNVIMIAYVNLLELERKRSYWTGHDLCIYAFVDFLGLLYINDICIDNLTCCSMYITNNK